MAAATAPRAKSELCGYCVVIFVTVGTTHFDSLIQAVDQLVADKQITERVICQIGAGKYEPMHCEFFRFQKSIDDWLTRADLVLTHGGSTVFALLVEGRRFVAVANTDLAHDHQSRFLRGLSQEVPILWTRNASDLAQLIQMAFNREPCRLNFPRLGDDLAAYINSL